MKKIITFLVALATMQLSAQCIQKMNAGASYTVVVKSDGTLWGWGRNNYGQLGIGNTTNTAAKTQVGTDSNWQDIYAGQYHTIGIKTDRTLWAWGKNTYGQLGNSTTSDRNTPIQIGTASWQSVSGGADHTVAIKTDGTLWAWGLNDRGQLGSGNTFNRSSPFQIGSGNNWKSVATGNDFTIALKTDGTMWSWGSNDVGQLGNGSGPDRNSPVQVGTDNNWLSVSTGNSHSLAIKTDGTLWAWGSNGRGQVGDGTTAAKYIPTKIGTDTDWQMVDGGFFYSMALKTNGTLWTWGWGTFYSVGQGDSQANVIVPTQVGTDSNWQTISSGQNALFGHALKPDGALWGWGYNNYAQSGNGNTVSLHVPTYITCPASSSITVEACDSYTWAATGTTYTASGVYIDLATNNDLQLTIKNSTASTATESACETYTWAANGQTYTQSGTYTFVTTNTAGCTDTATLNLVINHNQSINIAAVACESYTWAANGTTYNESGVYSKTTTDATGCETTTTLTLTINSNTSETLNETACGSYTLNGTTYNTSGTYTQIGTNASGCEKTTTLNLTINNNTSETLNETACSSYTLNGTTYNTSGTYTQTSTNASGCQHTTTLNLTINNAQEITADHSQSLASGATLADIAISPANVVWYASITDASVPQNPLPASTVLTDNTTYYAVTNAQGCASAPFAVTVSVFLSNKVFGNSQFSLYPNPTTDLITIIHSKAINSVSVLNVLGQQLFSKNIGAREGQIDMSHLNAGTYFVKVTAGDSTKILKVIKK